MCTVYRTPQIFLLENSGGSPQRKAAEPAVASLTTGLVVLKADPPAITIVPWILNGILLGPHYIPVAKNLYFPFPQSL